MQQGTLDGADAGGRDVSILGGVFLGMLGEPVQCRAQVLDIVEQDALLVEDAVQDVEHTSLGIVQTQNAGHQVGAHLADGGAHGDALLAEHIIEPHGATLEGEVLLLHAELWQPFLDKARQFAWLADAGEVPLHVGHETRHTGLAETLGDDLQGHRLARSRSSGDQAVAVSHIAQDADGTVRPVGDVESVFLSVHSDVVLYWLL